MLEDCYDKDKQNTLSEFKMVVFFFILNMKINVEMFQLLRNCVKTDSHEFLKKLELECGKRVWPNATRVEMYPAGTQLTLSALDGAIPVTRVSTVVVGGRLYLIL